jgi:hypothetical protein
VKTFKIIYWILTALLFIDTIIYLTNHISLAGYWSDKVLFWAWLITTLIIAATQFSKKWMKGYFVVLGSIIILSMLPMMIPFISIISFAFGGEGGANFELNQGIKIQEGRYNGIGLMPAVHIIKNYGIFEKIICETDFEFSVNENYYRLEDAKAVRLLNPDEIDTLKIEFQFDEGKLIREVPIQMP